MSLNSRHLKPEENSADNEGGKFNVSIPFPQEGEPEADVGEFTDLHNAIRDGNARRNAYNAESQDSTSDEDDEEPPETEPRKRFLWACQYNKPEIVECLLKADKNLLTYRDGDGYTGLHRAAYSDHHELVLFLLIQGADIGSKTNDGWIPLHSACRWNAFKSAQILLNWGSDPNAATDGGQTPLHLAAFHGKAKETLQILLLYPHIDGTKKNAQQDTPKDIAYRMSKEYASIFDLILLPAVRAVTED